MPNGRRRHYRLTLDDALDAHRQALRFGGLPGVINLGSIKSAIARPYSGYYPPTIGHKAAALVESMVGNHGFADGNKRTTLILLNLLLERSGYRLTPSAKHGSIQAEVEDMIMGVARKQLLFDDLVKWFGKRIIRA